MKAIAKQGVAVVSLVLLTSGLVQAQQGNRVEQFQAKLNERFGAADQDKDGWITRAEADAGMPFVARHFDQIDTQSKGRLSRDDIVAYIASRAAERQR